MSNVPKKLWLLGGLSGALIASQVVLVAATSAPAEQAQEPTCPGETMGVQATGVYVNRPVPEFVVNGEPWGGAYWEGGMRSYWHCHTAGQLLHVWEGEGRTQKRGERMRTLHKGDSDWAGPGEEHWHGAAAHTHAQFLQGSPTPSQTLWMEEVSETDYMGNGIGMETRAEFLRTGVREQPRGR
ncbi:MAG: cupin domain-containing protein [Gemmatimonadetes bacterium]|nr:cupin domain-containing protein [Gemmatimonadota bacterium]